VARRRYGGLLDWALVRGLSHGPPRPEEKEKAAAVLALEEEPAP